MFIKLFQCQLITSKNLLVPMGRHGPSNTVLKHWKGKLQSHQQSSRRRTEQVKKQRDVGASTERLRKLVWEQVQKISRWCNHWPPKIFYFNCSPLEGSHVFILQNRKRGRPSLLSILHPAHSFSLWSMRILFLSLGWVQSDDAWLASSILCMQLIMEYSWPVK